MVSVVDVVFLSDICYNKTSRIALRAHCQLFHFDVTEQRPVCQKPQTNKQNRSYVFNSDEIIKRPKHPFQYG